MFAVCAPRHALTRKRSVSWADVAAHDHIMLRNVYSVRRSLDRVAADLNLEFRYRIEAGMLISALKLVGAGLGITVVPGYACDLARQLGLRILPIDGARRHGHELWLIQRRNARLSLAASAFLQATEDYLRLRQAEGD
jgi:DNA-binding transcriptional LysR family regulator